MVCTDALTADAPSFLCGHGGACGDCVLAWLWRHVERWHGARARAGDHATPLAPLRCLQLTCRGLFDPDAPLVAAAFGAAAVVAHTAVDAVGDGAAGGRGVRGAPRPCAGVAVSRRVHARTGARHAPQAPPADDPANAAELARLSASIRGHGDAADPAVAACTPDALGGALRLYAGGFFAATAAAAPPPARVSATGPAGGDGRSGFGESGGGVFVQCTCGAHVRAAQWPTLLRVQCRYARPPSRPHVPRRGAPAFARAARRAAAPRRHAPPPPPPLQMRCDVLPFVRQARARPDAVPCGGPVHRGDIRAPGRGAKHALVADTLVREARRIWACGGFSEATRRAELLPAETAAVPAAATAPAVATAAPPAAAAAAAPPLPAAAAAHPPSFAAAVARTLDPGVDARAAAAEPYLGWSGRFRAPLALLPPPGAAVAAAPLWHGHDMRQWPPSGEDTSPTLAWLYMPLIYDTPRSPTLRRPRAWSFDRRGLPLGWAGWVEALRAALATLARPAGAPGGVAALGRGGDVSDAAWVAARLDGEGHLPQTDQEMLIVCALGRATRPRPR